MIPVEIVTFEGQEMKILHRGFVSKDNFRKFNMVKDEDDVVRISDLLKNFPIPEFVEALNIED